MTKKYTIIAYSCLNKYLNDIDVVATKYSIPVRALVYLDNNSLAILPQNEHIIALKKLYESELLGYEADVLWTNDANFQLDIDISQNADLINEIQAKINFNKNKKCAIVVSPYSNTDYTQVWTNKLSGIDTILGESPHLTKEYSGKNIFHRAINNNEEEILKPILNHLNIPKGYTVYNSDELKQAYKALKQQGVSHFLIKPVYGSSGRGIISVDEDTINNTAVLEPLVLCEKIAVAYNTITNSELNCSVELLKGKILGKPTEQILDGKEWIGGIVPSVNSSSFLDSAIEQTKKILSYLKTKGLIGFGGFDFIGDKQGKCYLIDNNLCRETGAHFPQYFQNKYAKNIPFAAVKINNNTKSLDEIWALLKMKNVAFSKKTGKGIFPIIYLQNILAVFICFADSSIEAYKNIQKFTDSCL
jgi:hypothetical protein